MILNKIPAAHSPPRHTYLTSEPRLVRIHGFAYGGELYFHQRMLSEPRSRHRAILEACFRRISLVKSECSPILDNVSGMPPNYKTTQPSNTSLNCSVIKAEN